MERSTVLPYEWFNRTVLVERPTAAKRGATTPTTTKVSAVSLT